MSETMIEKVAKAICVSSGQPWGSASADYRDICMELARAAIEAMREPHPLQLYPGVHAYIEVESTCRPVAFRAGWNAVIDAALSQSPHSLPSEDR